MTVNQLIAALEKLRDDGHGEMPVTSPVEYMGHGYETYLWQQEIVKLEIVSATTCQSDQMEGRAHIKVMSKDH